MYQTCAKADMYLCCYSKNYCEVNIIQTGLLVDNDIPLASRQSLLRENWRYPQVSFSNEFPVLSCTENDHHTTHAVAADQPLEALVHAQNFLWYCHEDIWPSGFRNDGVACTCEHSQHLQVLWHHCVAQYSIVLLLDFQMCLWSVCPKLTYSAFYMPSRPLSRANLHSVAIR